MASPLTSSTAPSLAYSSLKGFVGRIQNASGNAQAAFSNGADVLQLSALANTLFANKTAILTFKDAPRLSAYAKTAQADTNYDLLTDVQGFLSLVTSTLGDIDALMKSSVALATWVMPNLTSKSFTAAEVAALRTNLLAVANY